MPRVFVNMIARNEAHRHLAGALSSAREVAFHTGGAVCYTDDASTDDSLRLAIQAGCFVQPSQEPLFWDHEGSARNRAYQFTASHCEPGDWILSLDADETISNPALLEEVLQDGVDAGAVSMSLPLYEFWTPTEYRVDGFWFGARPRRLFEYRPDAQIPMREFACGSEPEWVTTPHPTWSQDAVHLLHWGYVTPEDRPRKHQAYVNRAGGHGHSSAHVNSIVTEPTLRTYV